jgi:hypothetical protein
MFAHAAGSTVGDSWKGGRKDRDASWRKQPPEPVIKGHCFLPVIEFSKSNHPIEDFNPKSIKIGEIIGKVYKFKNGKNALNHANLCYFG